ncbi:MAG TPA: sulfotransferase [Holophagaceae bacterium]|nr:sulfotransferase [Holophagaceae bacterium]
MASPPPEAPGPTFFIIGAAKAATSSLASLLEQHPEAAIARGKEPHFFSFDPNYRQGWESYLTLFRHGRGRKALGDASTSYSRLRYHPEALDRIARHVPEARILYLVRHPLERMESAYAEQLRTPGAPPMPTINEAVQRMPMILDSSRYGEVHAAYCARFGEERVKVLWFEDYIAHPWEVFREVCRFLGLDERFTPSLAGEVRNARAPGLPAQALAWRPEVRHAVLEALREDNLRFLARLGRPLDHWGGLYGA